MKNKLKITVSTRAWARRLMAAYAVAISAWNGATDKPSANKALTQQLFLVYHPECGAIDFSDIQSEDTLLINTESNLYSFRITQDKILRGKLSKSNNDEATEAIFVGSMICEQRQFKMLRSKLKIQAQAIFLVLHDDQFIELVTLPIVGISLLTTVAPERVKRAGELIAGLSLANRLACDNRPA